jgi:hypothetical protein
MGRPTAAPAHFPYMDHKTVAEIWWGKLPQVEERIADYTRISRSRALTEAESASLEVLIRKQSRLAA